MHTQDNGLYRTTADPETGRPDYSPSAGSTGSVLPLDDNEWLILDEQGEKLRPDLLERTEHNEEHPDWYDGPCYCQLCMSYGD